MISTITNAWTTVHLFKNNNKNIYYYSSNRIIENYRYDVYKWCEENIGDEGESWIQSGITVYSYCIRFMNTADATAFKLRFGQQCTRLM